MSSIFQSVATGRKRYNNFNLTCEYLCTGQIGALIPIQVDEVVPGDYFDEKVSFLMRFDPLSAPAMARMNVHFHSFYVPYRLLTPQTSRKSRWEEFMENIGSVGADIPILPNFKPLSDVWTIENADDVAYPYKGQGLGGYYNQLLANEVAIGTLWDYLGLYSDKISDISGNEVLPTDYPQPGLSLMPFLAYQLINDQWFRRDQIESPMAFPLNLGTLDIADLENADYVFDQKELEDSRVDELTNLHNIFALRFRNYERDYFTSALPEPQIGEDVPVGSNAVYAAADEVLRIISRSTRSTIAQDGTVNPDTTRINLGFLIEGSGEKYNNPDNVEISYPSNSAGEGVFGFASPGGPTSFSDLVGTPTYHGAGNVPPYTFIQVDKPEVQGLYTTPITVNDLRIAVQLQGVREKVNRGGTRFIEIMQSIYHVGVDDLRLQRVQYLGGTKVPVQIGTVVQTSETNEQGKLGTLAGKALAAGGTSLFRTKREFNEHGYVVTLMSVTPRTSYFGGVARKWLKHDPIDFYVPDFDHLGEQEIYNIELYGANILGAGADSDRNYMETFGYTPRYAELKSSYGTVTGEFRDSLDNWHTARAFDDAPVLSPEFIKIDKEDVDRIFEFQNVANTSNSHFQCQTVITKKAKRNMSKYSTPFTFY